MQADGDAINIGHASSTTAPMPAMLDQFAGLLRVAIGLDVASIGAPTLARAVRERQAACAIEDLHAYWQHVQQSNDELQELIETVTVPETWFFRERGAFAAMAQVVQQHWLPEHPDRPLRVLSLPCSTGEEPYSIAMALLEAGLPAKQMQIDAIDISAQALVAARRAIYGRNSFRGAELGFRQRHFRPSGHGYRLAPDVGRLVHFRQGNIFAPDVLPDFARYDIIFCRNVLIYFDADMQDRAISRLLGWLHEPGWLFVGSAETALLRARGMAALSMPMAFGFQRATASRAAAPLTPAPAKTPAPPTVSPNAFRQFAPALTTPVTSTVAPPIASCPILPEPAEAPSLAHAARLADLGQLDQAAALCQQHLHRNGPSPQALYLLGLVQDALGHRQQAERHYRKALYLDPEHGEALAHLACLLEQQGDTAGAARLHQRLARLSARSGNSS